MFTIVGVNFYLKVIVFIKRINPVKTCLWLVCFKTKLSKVKMRLLFEHAQVVIRILHETVVIII